WRVGRDPIGIDRLQGVHHAFADAARRHVDHAPQAHIVVGIDDQLQVGERVLDLLALVEADAADDLVRDVFPHQLIFYRARLGVGPVEDRHYRVDVVGAKALDRLGDEVRLLELVAAAVVDDLLAALAIGPEALILAIAIP